MTSEEFMKIGDKTIQKHRKDGLEGASYMLSSLMTCPSRGVQAL
jgi:hypothetical protein